jgi:hypothetical protein
MSGFHGFGVLAKEYGNLRLPIRVLQSNAGYYIGTADDDSGPVSRESLEYFRTKEMAEDALKTRCWTQRQTP